jgi:hypothetical protein
MSRLCELKAAGGAELMTAVDAAFPQASGHHGPHLRRVASGERNLGGGVAPLSRVFA